MNPALSDLYAPNLPSEAVAAAQAELQGRVKGLAVPLWFPLAQEEDPAHVGRMIFHTAPFNLPPGVINALNQAGIVTETILDFLWEVVTGQTDNWWAIGGNIALGFLPITGIILDFIAIFTEATGWGRAFAVIGFVASVVSDGAAVLTAIGALVPVTLAATVPGTALLEAIDVGASVLRAVDSFVSAQTTYNLIKKIPFDKALTLGGDLLGHLARRAWTTVEGTGWPGSKSRTWIPGPAPTAGPPTPPSGIYASPVRASTCTSPPCWPIRSCGFPSPIGRGLSASRVLRAGMAMWS